MTDLAGQNKTFFFDNSGVAADANAPYTNSGAAAQLTLDQLNAAGVVSESGGAIADGAGALSLALAGSGEFLFNGANAFSGDVEIEGSTLAAVAADDALGSGGILFTAGAGKLEAAANFATAQSIVIEAGVSATLEAAAGDTLTASGSFAALGGQGSTLIVGSATDDGTVVLAGSASEDALGALEIAAGTLRLGGAGAAALLTALTGGVTIDGALDLDGQSVTLTELAGAGSIVNSGALATLTLGADYFAFAGTITGAVALVVSGGAGVTLTGANTYTGGTTIFGGELNLGDGAKTGSLAGPVVDNAVLNFDEPGSLSFAGALSGSGWLEVTSGHIALTGDTSGFTGNVVLNSLGMTLTADNAFSHIAGLELYDAATLETTKSLTLASSVSIMEGVSNSATLEAAAGATLTLAGSLSVATGIIVHIGSAADGGTVVFDYNNRPFDDETGFQQGDVIEIDGGTLYALAGEYLAPVVFKGIGGRLILNGSLTYASSAAGASGEVYLDNAQVDLSGGDDLVYFVPGTDDAATLSNTGGLWDAVYGSNGKLTLDDALASIVGGGDVVLKATVNSAVSLFNTGGDWDTLYGVDLVYLTNAQAAVVDSPASVFLLGADDAVSFYYSNTAWDSVYGSNGVISATASRASIVGGADQVYLLDGGAQDLASLFNTGGEWDAVYGSNAVLALTNAQAAIVGGDDVVYLLGTSDAISLYNATSADTVYGSNGVVILNDAQATIVGGGDTVALSGSANLAEISATDGAWDGVDATNASVLLDSAQAAIYGYGDTIFMNGPSTVSETLTGAHDAFVFQQAMGVSTISGFGVEDTIQLSKADFSSIQDIFNHMSQPGDDTIIKLDANDQITLTGALKANLAPSQFSLM